MRFFVLYLVLLATYVRATLDAEGNEIPDPPANAEAGSSTGTSAGGDNKVLFKSGGNFKPRPKDHYWTGGKDGEGDIRPAQGTEPIRGLSVFSHLPNLRNTLIGKDLKKEKDPVKKKNMEDKFDRKAKQYVQELG